MTLTTARHFAILLGAFFLVPTGLLAESVAESSTKAVAAAEKEGAVNFYFVWNLEHGQALKKVFQRKYPSIEVNLYRSGASAMVSKLDIEAKAGRNEADVIIMSDLYW